jgi:DHA2 family multidrug resistance protein-like MFS transporter
MLDPTGFLSDRVPAGILGGIGMAINAGAMLLMALLPDQAAPLDVGWRMALAGVGFGLYLAPNARLIVSSTPWHRAASAGGLISTNRLTGQTLGATLAAALLAVGLGSGRAPAYIACGLMLVALACSVARLRAKPDQGQSHGESVA